MTPSKAGPWIIGTVLLAVVLLAAAWFLAVSPQLDEASASRDQEQQELDRADLLEVQIAQLKKDFAEIETYRADLGALQVEIPTTVDQASFNRELATLSEASGAFVVEVSSTTSVPVIAQVDVSGGTPSASMAAAPSGMYAVPMTVTVLGNPAQVLAYIDGLRNSTTRAFLITGISLSGQDEAGAASGRPATAKGDAEVVISGYTYVLDAGAGAAEPATEGAVTPAVAN